MPTHQVDTVKASQAEHDKVDRDGGDIGHELEYVATGQGWGRALHAGKLAHFGGALKWLRPVRKKYLFSRGDCHTSRW